MTGEQILHTTVLTPTARLALAESLRLARARVADGAGAWLRPPVLAFPVWLGQLREDWFLAGDDDRVPVSGDQASVIWHEVIDRDIFIGEPRVADLAADAWRLIHEYRLDDPDDWDALWMNEDARRFRAWAQRFRQVLAERGLVDEWTFAAELPGLIGQGRIELTECIRLTGFELPPTPLQEAVIEAAEKAGCRIERDEEARPPSAPEVIDAYTDPDEELRAAAEWTRQRLEDDPEQSIAIVVPDLRQRLSSAERIARQVFDPPGFALDAREQAPFHVSLGPPLSQWPLVTDALHLLGLDPGRMSQPQAGRLLRSPWLADAEDEEIARAQALARLHARRPYWIHAGQLAQAARDAGAERLAARLAEWDAGRRGHRDRALPSAWVARFQSELDALGFGHGRALGSREYQVLARWHELLEALAALDVVITRPIARSEALRGLRERAGAQAFRERNPGCPVEILGVAEALGSRFDAVWITTLDNDIWPGPARREPLVPAEVQSNVPSATGDGCLARARAELDGLLRIAGEVRGSFARGSAETERQVTPLLGGVRVREVEREVSAETVALEPIADDITAPAFAGGELRGGTSVLQAQSNCPFQALAVWRLGADDLTPPQPGLDARDRGSLVHRALESFWTDLDGSEALQALAPADRERRIEAATEAALAQFESRSPLALSRTGRELEARCLNRSLRRWLALEAERAPFTIRALESPVEMKFGHLELTGKIDRIDTLAGGGEVVIDYKTGNAGRNGWFPDQRLADVQLPAYALSLPERPVAIAFGKLRPDQLGFEGIAEVDCGTAGVAVIGQISRQAKFGQIESWPDLTESWRAGLQQLAVAFSAGRAEVDPRDNDVCKRCHLHALCRINERVSLPGADDE